MVDKELKRWYEGVFFRTYSFLDLLNLAHINNLVKRGKDLSSIPHIPDKTILSVYDGQTIFSIFKDAEPVLDQLFMQAKQRRSEESHDAFRKITEDVFMRRLYRIMKLPTEKVEIEEENYLEVFLGKLAL